MKTLDEFLNYHKHERFGGLLAVELRSESDLCELYKLIIPPLQPPNKEEIINFFTSDGFADDIKQTRELTNEEDEAVFSVLRWAYPEAFYGSEIKVNAPIYHDTRKDRYLFFDFHSHPLSSISLPSSRDLKIFNQITAETLEKLESEKEFGYLPENFDVHYFRPIFGIGSFWWDFDNYDSEFQLLLLQWKKEAKESDFTEDKIKTYENIKIAGLAWDYLTDLPYNTCTLNYRFNKNQKKYVLDGKNELRKLDKFSSKITKI